jgi:hypothetical protein
VTDEVVTQDKEAALRTGLVVSKKKERKYMKSNRSAINFG